jgi:hypothetical protein
MLRNGQGEYSLFKPSWTRSWTMELKVLTSYISLLAASFFSSPHHCNISYLVQCIVFVYLLQNRFSDISPTSTLASPRDPSCYLDWESILRSDHQNLSNVIYQVSLSFFAEALDSYIGLRREIPYVALFQPFYLRATPTFISYASFHSLVQRLAWLGLEVSAFELRWPEAEVKFLLLIVLLIWNLTVLSWCLSHLQSIGIALANTNLTGNGGLFYCHLEITIYTPY